MTILVFYVTLKLPIDTNCCQYRLDKHSGMTSTNVFPCSPFCISLEPRNYVCETK